MKNISFIDSEQELAVGKILCLGQNYAAHIKEMRAEVPAFPVIFIKPPSALISGGANIILPKISHEVHHEVELVAVIGKSGKNIPRSEALKHAAGYGVGLDMTLRDIQREAKKKGLPWAVAKGFDTSAPVSAMVSAHRIGNPQNLTISCRVNGVLRQRSSTSAMIFSMDRIIEYLSSVFTLEAGDLIFTGTPEGVGEVKEGDTIEAELEGYVSISHFVQSA